MVLWYGIVGFVLIMAASMVRGTDKFEDFCIGFFLVLFLLLLLVPTMIESALRPYTWDARLQAADLWLGLDGFAWAKIWLATKWLRNVTTQVYWGLPLAFGISWSLERSRTMVTSMLLAGALTFPLYLLIPAAGPAYAFRGWPFVSASGGWDLMAVAAAHPRNCFPSMHLAWALLLPMNATSRVWKAILLLNAVLTGLATIGGGEHYFVDLIAAVPFAFAIQWLAEKTQASTSISKEHCSVRVLAVLEVSEPRERT